MTINIRDAVGGDATSLAEIEDACFREGYADKMLSRDEFSELISSNTDEVIIATLANETVGYALLIVHPKERIGDFDSLAVSPKHQGKGIGEILFRSVESKCELLGLHRLNLEIREDNYTLLKRYHRFGYKSFEVEEGFYADGAGAIRMYKIF